MPRGHLYCHFHTAFQGSLKSCSKGWYAFLDQMAMQEFNKSPGEQVGFKSKSSEHNPVRIATIEV